MYFITPIDSETGKKFQAIQVRRTECFKAQKELSAKYGFKQWRVGHFCIFGGISSAIFTDIPDTAVWKKNYGKNEWMPKLSSTQGKKIKEEFDKLPRVTNEELNAIAGFDEDMSCIGYATNNKDFFGFIVDEDWDAIIPKDCEEITITRYNQLFPKNKPDENN